MTRVHWSVVDLATCFLLETFSEPHIVYTCPEIDKYDLLGFYITCIT